METMRRTLSELTESLLYYVDDTADDEDSDVSDEEEAGER
jgi:hypothetical protein